MKENVLGCLLVIVVFGLAAFFFVAEVAKGIAWMKWAFN